MKPNFCYPSRTTKHGRGGPRSSGRTTIFCKECGLGRLRSAHLPKLLSDFYYLLPPQASGHTLSLGGPTLEEIAEARSDMEQLEKQVHRLAIVHATTHAQKKRLNQLLSRRSLINHIPVELLAKIIDFTIYNFHISKCHAHFCLKRKLASVSRRWRDTILNWPAFRTTIILHPTFDHSFVTAHLARSRGLPLDITIERWSAEANEDKEKFVRLLNIVLSCRHRWQSPFIEDFKFLRLTLIRINGWVFPLLRRVSFRRHLSLLLLN